MNEELRVGPFRVRVEGPDLGGDNWSQVVVYGPDKNGDDTVLVAVDDFYADAGRSGDPTTAKASVYVTNEEFPDNDPKMIVHFGVEEVEQ